MRTLLRCEFGKNFFETRALMQKGYQSKGRKSSGFRSQCRKFEVLGRRAAAMRLPLPSLNLQSELAGMKRTRLIQPDGPWLCELRTRMGFEIPDLRFQTGSAHGI